MKELRKPKKVRPVENPNIPKRVVPAFTSNDDMYQEALKIDKVDHATFFKALRNAAIISHYGTYGFPTPENNYPNNVGIKGTLVGYMLYHVRQFGLGEMDRRNLAHLIEVVKRSKLFSCQIFQKKEAASYLVGLIHLAKWKWAWIRNPELWEPPCAGSRAIFSSLARYLLAKYDVPEFFDRVWFENNDIHKQWFINIGMGENLRAQEGLPIPITKKMAHFAMKAPNMCSINQAIRWGQIFAMGGDERIAAEIIRTPMGEDFSNDEFWTSVLRFFIDNPFLDTHHYRQIYDYIFDQKFRERGHQMINGVWQRVGPEQPNLSMHKRDPFTLLDQVERWHARLNRGHYYAESFSSVWSSCGIPKFELKERGALYEIRELLSSGDLFAEGKEMHHCVGSYAHSCSNGKSAIFSLAKYGEDAERMATIQVELSGKMISQVAKKCNARATTEDWKVIKRWASLNGLGISNWLDH